MVQAFSCVLLLLSLNATTGKYFYIKEEMSWEDAQKYCQTFYTDLAPVTNEDINTQSWDFAGSISSYSWIGLQRDSTAEKKWMWSGGGEVSTFFWAPGQPTAQPGDDYGVIRNYMWYSARGSFKYPFYCYSAVVVRKRKTWEEALDYCREYHCDLASVMSQEKMLLIQVELLENATTEFTWMGLRFLSESWKWVNGHMLSYEAWGAEGKPACPDVKLKCGALKLMNATQPKRNVDVVNMDTGKGVPGERSVDVNMQSVWEAHNCEEKLHFICY